MYESPIFLFTKSFFLMKPGENVDYTKGKKVVILSEAVAWQ
jgi:hypothetical protein